MVRMSIATAFGADAQTSHCGDEGDNTRDEEGGEEE